MTDTNEEDKPKIEAKDHSISVGSIRVGGNVGGDFHIGTKNVYQYASEEDVPLSSAELEHGLQSLAGFLPERAPVLETKFATLAKRLRATLGADVTALSPTLRAQRLEAV